MAEPITVSPKGFSAFAGAMGQSAPPPKKALRPVGASTSTAVGDPSVAPKES